jgi:hypothetical protein
LKLHFLELELVCSPDVEIEVAKFNVLGKEWLEEMLHFLLFTTPLLSEMINNFASFSVRMWFITLGEEPKLLMLENNMLEKKFSFTKYKVI